MSKQESKSTEGALVTHTRTQYDILLTLRHIADYKSIIGY